MTSKDTPDLGPSESTKQKGTTLMDSKYLNLEENDRTQSVNGADVPQSKPCCQKCNNKIQGWYDQMIRFWLYDFIKTILTISASVAIGYYTLKGQVDTLQSQVNNLEFIIATLEPQFNELSQQAIILSDESAALNASIIILDSEVTSLTTQVDSLNLTTLTLQVDDLSNQIQSLNQSVQDLTTMVLIDSESLNKTYDIIYQNLTNLNNSIFNDMINTEIQFNTAFELDMQKLQEYNNSILDGMFNLNESIMLELSQYNTSIITEIVQINDTILSSFIQYNNSVFSDWLAYNYSVFSNWSVWSTQLEDSISSFNETFEIDMLNLTTTNQNIFTGLEFYNNSIFVSMSDYNESIFVGLEAWATEFEANFTDNMTEIEKRQDQQARDMEQLNVTVEVLQENVTEIEKRQDQQAQDVGQLDAAVEGLQANNTGKLLQLQLFASTQGLSMLTANHGSWFTFPETFTVIPKSITSTIFIEAYPNIYFQRQTATGDWCMSMSAQLIINNTTESNTFAFYNENSGTNINSYVTETLPLFYQVNNTNGNPIKINIRIKGDIFTNCGTFTATNGYYGINSFGVNSVKISEFGV